MHHTLKLLLPAAAAALTVAATAPAVAATGRGHVARPSDGGAFAGPTEIRFQVRVHGTSTWHLTPSTARVGKKGRFSVRGEFTGAGTFDVRFRYLGGAWAPTRSKALVITVS